MNFVMEMKSVGIPCSCVHCEIVNCKNRHKYQLCDSFFPSDIKRFMLFIADYLKLHTEKSKDKHLIRRPLKDTRSGLVYDDNNLDKYYVGLINDTLSQIRSGGTAYLFHLSQIADIMKYENVDFTYNSNDGCFAIRLNKGDNKND